MSNRTQTLVSLFLFLVVGPICLQVQRLQGIGLAICLTAFLVLIYRLAKFVVHGPQKICPDCQMHISSRAKVCPYCQYKFDEKKAPQKTVPVGGYDPFGLNAPVDLSKKDYTT